MKIDLQQIVKEIKKRLRRAKFNMNEALGEHGDESREFLWSKCEVETLESVLWLIERVDTKVPS